MPHLHVDVAATTATAARLQALAARAAEVDVTGPLVRAADAVAGGRLAATAATEAGEWSRELAALTVALRAYGTAVQAAAAHLQRTDATAVR